ncbi:MAG: DUF6518 family protein [Woeseiaceae bacterium]|nr:DUF6518 family protein [Woeseiaceae bacterium]
MLADFISFYVPIAVAIERVIAAIAGYFVYKDADQRAARTYNLHPIWWGLATFFAGPILGVAAYWLIHHSGLAQRGAAA